MTSIDYASIEKPTFLPTLDRALLVTALVAGAFATIGFDLFGQFISPLMKSVASP